MADSSMRDYGIAAPHGPNMGGQHVATADIMMDMNKSESDVFRSLLLPDDSYDETGTYWADMPLWRRLKFVNKVDSQEAKKELSSIGRMIKNDPLSPIGYYMRNMVIPGAGLLLEGYVLFSIGNVKPLLASAFPGCWDSHTVCNETWLQSIEYLEIVGIIVGQILVGIVGDWMGRRFGLIQDATIMFIGLLMLTAAWGVTLNGWVICYVWSLFFYGIGVGGEYPMTATSGMENAVGSGKVSTRDDRLHRGRKVTSAFLMQGWGQFLNQVILILLLLIFHSGSGNPPYSKVSVQWTYRVSFAIPAVGTLWLVYFRTYKMKSASKQLAIAKKKQHVTGYDVQSLKLTLGFFGPRLIATAGAWFANDVFFYGNKLFQAQFISVLNPGSQSVMTNWLWNLVNVGVALCGYYLASFMIDNKLYGRKWMQIIGFLLDFILFVIPAFNYEYYALLTWLFLPDTTGLDLKEQERRWAYIRDGREADYHGVAIHPKHLSVWERLRGVGKHYDAARDYEQRVEEMRGDWEAAMARRAEEKEGKEDLVDEDGWSSEVSTFFERTKGRGGNAKGNGSGPLSPVKAAQANGAGKEALLEEDEKGGREGSSSDSA